MHPLLVALLLTACQSSTPPSTDREARQTAGRVERDGIHADLKAEHIVTGNLAELNGKYKLRVAAVTYESGGFIGNHHHAGPGLRCVTSGTLTYTQEGKALNFQVLPSDWEGSSAITVTAVPE